MPAPVLERQPQRIGRRMLFNLPQTPARRLAQRTLARRRTTRPKEDIVSGRGSERVNFLFRQDSLPAQMVITLYAPDMIEALREHNNRVPIENFHIVQCRTKRAGLLGINYHGQILPWFYMPQGKKNWARVRSGQRQRFSGLKINQPELEAERVKILIPKVGAIRIIQAEFMRDVANALLGKKLH